MAIKITEQNGTFFVDGVLNASTVKSFKNHFNSLFNVCSDFTLNIDNITEMDNNGLFELYKLCKNSTVYHKNFVITGSRSKEIYENFRLPQVA